jgi:hypothetical protein
MMAPASIAWLLILLTDAYARSGIGLSVSIMLKMNRTAL